MKQVSFIVPDDKVIIYGLFEIGKEHEFKYIGMTKNKPSQRLSEHKSTSKHMRTYRDKWMQSVYRKGGYIGITIIEIVDKNIWEEKKKFFG